jgi:hypothetical protein
LGLWFEKLEHIPVCPCKRISFTYLTSDLLSWETERWTWFSSIVKSVWPMRNSSLVWTVIGKISGIIVVDVSSTKWPLLIIFLAISNVSRICSLEWCPLIHKAVHHVLGSFAWSEGYRVLLGKSWKVICGWQVDSISEGKVAYFLLEGIFQILRLCELCAFLQPHLSEHWHLFKPGDQGHMAQCHSLVRNFRPCS